ncbi:FecR family protein [Synechococcus sp. PCC 7502]|uniref:FecR domain-containing protein n=1 Tax=Synechococcus sp. PCC 7502 TaxID=1173263 RepID=UPI00029F8747|nr:FecR domain-containing protein [Synechococcus sp. PCC 7502]AFY72231.1 FecR family protein [Synechococcus sp. PCC 7502]
MIYRQGLKLLVLLGILLIPACVSNPPKPFSSEPIPSEAIGEITEIADRPVSIRLVQTNQDIVANLGKVIKLEEPVRTQGDALAQITLKTGVVIRMQGDTLVTINADNKIDLAKGKILVWVPANTTAQIKVSGAIASVKNATVYINSAQNLQIIGLQGTTEVLPVNAPINAIDASTTSNTPKLLVLKAGQNLLISQDGKYSPPKTLTTEDLKTQFKQIKLLSGFNSRLGSQEIISTNLKIPISPTDFVIPPNRPTPPKPSPVYYQEPYYPVEKTTQTRRSPATSPPTPVEVTNKAPQEIPPAPVQSPMEPEVVPNDTPPQPTQPEETEPSN